MPAGPSPMGVNTQVVSAPAELTGTEWPSQGSPTSMLSGMPYEHPRRSGRTTRVHQRVGTTHDDHFAQGEAVGSGVTPRPPTATAA